MEYYFTDDSNIKPHERSLYIKGEESKHLTKVLRKKVGDKIDVTDGKLNVYKCTIQSIHPGIIECEILSSEYNINEPEKDVTVYFALLKSMDRYEFGVEKLIEVGVKKIIPLITERTIVKEPLSKNKLIRLNKIILSAVSQSQRCFLPMISDTIDIKNIEGEKDSANIFMYEFAPSENVIPSISQKKVNVIIGPEGGFTEQEAQNLSKRNWKPYSLGKRKYRAETAAIVAASKIIDLK